MTVRQDLIDAYVEKWSCTPEYAEGMVRHVEVGYAEAERQAREQKMEELRQPGHVAMNPAEREGEIFHLTRAVQQYASFVEIVSATATTGHEAWLEACEANEKLQKENAALRAKQTEPRWSLYKGSEGEDAYVAWSGTVEAPVMVGTRDEMLTEGYSTERLDRADINGTSSHVERDWWGKGGYLIAEQRGILRREHLVEYSRLHLAGDTQKAFDLLEPFEDEAEVRRD